MVRIAVSVAAVAGVVLLAVSAVTRRVDLAALGVFGLIIMLVAMTQLRRDHPKPLVVLAAGLGGWAAVVPLVDGASAVGVLPALALLAFVAVLVLPRPTAHRFALWCWVAAVWSVPWLFPGMTFAEISVAAFVLGAIGVAGWRVVSLADDALIREEEKYRILFDSSPVAMFEEDFTAVSAWLEDLRSSGVRDLRSYLADRPEEVKKGVSLIRVTRANPAAARMTEAKSPDEIPDRLVIREEVELEGFIEQFVAIWEGRRYLALDLEGITSKGRPLEGVLHWSVPAKQGSFDLSRVVVTISDITPRKMVEERLARTLQANQRLLSFQEAVVSCSQALLLGTGEDAFHVALHALREAIGADRAYLAMNLDDLDLGPSFRLVNSAGKPESSQDEWLDRVAPWSRYPDAYQALSRGEPFHQLATPKPEEGWNQSLLMVPVFSGERWLGTIGFVDTARQTEWSDEAVRMLEVAAPMLGTFWERESTRQRLEELVESKDRFLATVSHELRTPLAAVLGFAEELRIHAASFQPEELTEMLELIADQSQDMTDMVEDLLVAARADIGTVSIHPQDVYLRSQAEAVLAGIGSADLSSVRVVGSAGKAWADPTRTRQIIRNLITNAVRYGGSEVVVEATTEQERTVLAVRDNGPGLPQSDWERIFEPYERAHDRATQPASMGLGLTVSRQLARLMGGNLTYRADESGSVFELTLPSTPQANERAPHSAGSEEKADLTTGTS